MIANRQCTLALLLAADNLMRGKHETMSKVSPFRTMIVINNRYILQQELGPGAMGAVDEARDLPAPAGNHPFRPETRQCAGCGWSSEGIGFWLSL
jgi:hypothetical protein